MTSKDKFINDYFNEKLKWDHPGQKQQITYIKLFYQDDNFKWEVLKNGKVEVWDFKIEGNDVNIGNHVFPLSSMVDDSLSIVECDMEKSRGMKGKGKLKVPRNIIKPIK